MRKPSVFVLAGVLLTGSAFAALAQSSTDNPNPSPPPAASQPGSQSMPGGSAPPAASPSGSSAQPGSMQNSSPSSRHPSTGAVRSKYQNSGMARAGKSSHVQEAQQALNQNGETLQVDGVMGSKTRAALKDFQTKHNLKVTGRLDRATRKALKPTG